MERAITSAIGSVIVFENEVVNLTGFAITSTIGAVAPDAEAVVTLETLDPSIFAVGTLLVYDQISTAQTPNYSNVATSQTPTYTRIIGGRDAA